MYITIFDLYTQRTKFGWCSLVDDARASFVLYISSYYTLPMFRLNVCILYTSEKFRVFANKQPCEACTETNPSTLWPSDSLYRSIIVAYLLSTVDMGVLLLWYFSFYNQRCVYLWYWITHYIFLSLCLYHQFRHPQSFWMRFCALDVDNPASLYWGVTLYVIVFRYCDVVFF